MVSARRAALSPVAMVTMAVSRNQSGVSAELVGGGTLGTGAALEGSPWTVAGNDGAGVGTLTAGSREGVGCGWSLFRPPVATGGEAGGCRATINNAPTKNPTRAGAANRENAPRQPRILASPTQHWQVTSVCLSARGGYDCRKSG